MEGIEIDVQNPVISPFIIVLIKNFFQSLKYIYQKDNNGDEHSFKLVTIKDTIFTFKILCMDPSIVFKSISNISHSIIISSGTLSPLDQLEEELNVKFDVKLSTRHIIDSSQVLPLIIDKLNNVLLSSLKKDLSKNSDQIFFEIGNFLNSILDSIPDGVLFFFPSNSILNSMISFWKEKKIFEKIQEKKPIFLLNSSNQIEDGKQLKEYTKEIDKKKKGAILMGVMRGRMSEGIDFADEQSRCVIIFGIPFPNLGDPDIVLKKKFRPNSDWYVSQTFRSVCQAIGRGIRNKNDYSSIILIDYRYQHERKYLPIWLEFESNFQRKDINYNLMLKNFYEKNNKKFSINNNIINLTCSNCANIILELNQFQPNIKEINSEYFQKLFNTKKFLYFKNIFKVEQFKDQYDWLKDDNFGVIHLKCSCNNIFGLLIDGVRTSNLDQLNDIYLDINKLNLTTDNISNPLQTILQG